MKIVTGPPNLRVECRCDPPVGRGNVCAACYRVSVAAAGSNGEAAREIFRYLFLSPPSRAAEKPRG